MSARPIATDLGGSEFGIIQLSEVLHGDELTKFMVYLGYSASALGHQYVEVG